MDAAREVAQLGQRGLGVLVGAREQLRGGLRVALDLLARHADLHRQRDQARLRTVVQVALDAAQLDRRGVDRARAGDLQLGDPLFLRPSSSTLTTLACTHALPRRIQAPTTRRAARRRRRRRTCQPHRVDVRQPIWTPPGIDQPQDGSVRKPRPIANPVRPATNDAVPIPNGRTSHTISRHVIGSVERRAQALAGTLAAPRARRARDGDPGQLAAQALALGPPARDPEVAVQLGDPDQGDDQRQRRDRADAEPRQRRRSPTAGRA